jgi:GWxTD domain-containing protein
MAMRQSAKNAIVAAGRRLAAAGRILACLVLAGAVLLPGQTKVNPKDLNLKYQEWLKLTSYIIKDKERDVFLSLTNDRDRDLFIEAFWNARDPTPGTPRNEFKDEHIKRFQEASRKFRFGSAREGWMTDQGRIHIILGPPISRSYFSGSLDLYPAEIWAYYGDTSKGMPSHFELLFFQWRNAGEMKLYDPVADGPDKLLVYRAEHGEPTYISPTDYQALYQRIRDLQPDLARATLSIIPGEIPYGFRPSLDTPIYMAAILDSPKRGLNDSYATHFLNLRGVVSTEYLTNYLPSAEMVEVLFDPQTGMAYCDFALAPERISMGHYEPNDEYFTNFQIDVSLRAGDKIVYQYSKEYPLTIPESEFKATTNMGICLADSFPVIEGQFRLAVLLRNTLGKEFSLLERDIEVPSASGPVRIVGPALGVKMSSVPPGVHLPFRVGDRKVNVDPKNAYAASDDIGMLFNVIGADQKLWKEGVVEVTVKGTTGPTPATQAFRIELAGRPFGRALGFAHVIAQGQLPPDYYEMILILRDGQGAALDERRASFVVSPSRPSPIPWWPRSRSPWPTGSSSNISWPSSMTGRGNSTGPKPPSNAPMS